jgi:hypothetical protein
MNQRRVVKTSRTIVIAEYETIRYGLIELEKTETFNRDKMRKMRVMFHIRGLPKGTRYWWRLNGPKYKNASDEDTIARFFEIVTEFCTKEAE